MMLKILYLEKRELKELESASSLLNKIVLIWDVTYGWFVTSLLVEQSKDIHIVTVGYAELRNDVKRIQFGIKKCRQK
jgi:hypothetical protein